MKVNAPSSYGDHTLPNLNTEVASWLRGDGRTSNWEKTTSSTRRPPHTNNAGRDWTKKMPAMVREMVSNLVVKPQQNIYADQIRMYSGTGLWGLLAAYWSEWRKTFGTPLVMDSKLSTHRGGSILWERKKRSILRFKREVWEDNGVVPFSIPPSLRA